MKQICTQKPVANFRAWPLKFVNDFAAGPLKFRINKPLSPRTVVSIMFEYVRFARVIHTQGRLQKHVWEGALP